MTPIEIMTNKNYYLHHVGSRRGYVSRKTDGFVEEYDGRFGRGYRVIRPRYDTTNYVAVWYYIEKKEA